MMIFFLTFIFLAVIASIAIATPLVILSNKKKLTEMDRLIAAYRETAWPPEHIEKARQALLDKLITIKAGIVADKNALEAARDKIAIL